MDRLTELEAFIRTVDLGSQAAAAAALGLSRMAVGRQIQALERRLGVRLLQRTTRRQALTEAGAAFYELTREPLRQLHDASDRASESRTSLHGRLRLSAPVSFGVRYLPSVLSRFSEQHPGVEIDLVLNDRIVDLVEEGFDLTLRIGRLADSSLMSRRLALCRRAICASPAYLARHGIPKHPADLLAHNCLRYTQAGQSQSWAMTAPDGTKEVVTVGGNLAANNGTALMMAALAGEGIILQPLFIVDEALRDGRLVQLLSTYRLGELELHAVFPAARYMPVKLRRFVDHLVESYAVGLP
ncbi:DNA-binding transcriptional LysR family regulator [Bradyrhizobium sp. JR1.5]|uniref:LysR substrate-binding domain-containing protein n=1 Tax=unclassified Bradyrhizobium TaxID=2631580 RepID=UPI00025D226A|nr:LysR substrate-binding domain-containing protein [Bradyrhizobium sp. WSM1253]EIG59145.1 transcriptional regulator [Bradyrhizobium sp. WSM1253]